MPALRPRPSLAFAALLSSVALAPAAHADTIRIQGTTDTRDAGLVDDLLIPAYKAAYPGDDPKYVPVGTGAALMNAQGGLADVVLTHAPSLEANFVKGGFSLEPFGHAIFYSDYVIVGPASDPAGVLTAAPHDAVTAFEKIAAAGAAGRATFVSRGDKSGTNVQEQIMWGMGDEPKVPASNAGGDATRSTPTGDWYRTTNKGQADNVLDADLCAYPNGGCYTITDRGTFNRTVNKGTITNLKVVSDHNLASSRGGENLLINPFSAYVVSPTAPLPAGSPVPNVAAARRFVDFLVSPAFQAAVDSYPSASDPAFRSDAVPAIALGTPLPQVAVAGSAVAIDLTATNKLPGGGVVAGLPVQLQASVDNGRTYADAGGPVSTDAAGRASLRPVLAANTKYRVTFPRYEQFTGSTIDLGLVAATPAPVTAAAKDTTKPAVSRPVLTARRLTLSLSEGATVRVTIARRTTKVARTHGKRRVTTVYRTAKRVTLKGAKAGTVSRSFKAIKAGTYRLTITATDAAGNTSQRTKTLTVKATTSKQKAG